MKNHFTQHKPAGLAIALVIAFLFLVVGCGQKGPLYLPQSKQPKPEATAPAPEAAKPATAAAKP